VCSLFLVAHLACVRFDDSPDDASAVAVNRVQIAYSDAIAHTMLSAHARGITAREDAAEPHGAARCCAPLCRTTTFTKRGVITGGYMWAT